MIRRLYIHNFRCLENFTLPISGQSSVLLIGKNGSGKTTVGLALEIFQKIARGTNRVGELVKPKDFFLGRTDAPMRFEIEVELDANIYEYVIAFEFPEGFKELRILEEKLSVGGKPLYTREGAQVHLAATSQGNIATDRPQLLHGKALEITGTKSTQELVQEVTAAVLASNPEADPVLIDRISRDDEVRIQNAIARCRAELSDPDAVAMLGEEMIDRIVRESFARAAAERAFERLEAERLEAERKDAKFFIDWHLVALPIVQEKSTKDPLFIFKQWLARMLILRPIPSLISGESEQETLEPNIQVTDFGAWFSGLLAYAPAAYTEIDAYLKLVMPDLKDIKNPATGTDSRSLIVQFSNGLGSRNLPFEELSDGEKCFMICAVVLAANNAYGPLLCFWDEPDSHLALDEVGHFVLGLRKAFQSGGQFIATSHNDEAIPRFSDENTFFLHRRNHLEPTIVRPIHELQIHGDLISALVRGDVEPAKLPRRKLTRLDK